MAVLLEQFVKHLEDSGVIAGDTLRDYIPPKASPKDAEELAKELIRQKKLTKFQAELLWQGKGKSLVLGNYLLMEKIGQGGMGAVYKAEHRRMKRVVAIKMLPPAMMKDAAAAARFQREVEAAAKLRHTNIVAADDADEANGVHFMVMECVEGSDLSALVKKNGPFPVAQAVNYILQAARGLEFAHKKGVVHRDIKPANLLLDNEGTVKILDMGLARIEGDSAGQAELTGTGAVMGTVDYMAPEQALNTKTADARADIYALGCSLFYLLTGQATYDGDTLMAKLLAHRDQQIPSLRAMCPEVTEQLEVVFKKMVAKAVQNRYQTMTEVIAALEQCGTRQEQSVSAKQSFSTTSDTGLTNFLKDIPIQPIQKAQPTKRVAAAKPGKSQHPPWKNTRVLIGAATLGLLFLAGIIVSLRTEDGTLVVTVDQPDAMVQVLDAEGKVEVSQKGGGGKITFSVDPGKHRLKVEKDGFEFFSKDFEIESGGKKAITAKLVPVEDTPELAVTTKPPVVETTDKLLANKSPPADAAVLNGHSYKFFPDVLTWHQAKARCEEMGGHLTIIESDAENSFVVDLTEKSIPDHGAMDGVWIGATDEHKEGEWKWVNANPLAFTKWNTSQPNNKQNAEHYLLLWLSKREWCDQPSKSSQHTTYFVCEWDTAPGNAGTNINDPAFQQWMIDVAALPAEEQVEAVSKKLVELNPGFDGKVTGGDGTGTPWIDVNGVVVGLGFVTDNVTDISPLRALIGLTNLFIPAGPQGSKLSDLSPLQGLKLNFLACSNAKVADLSPLQGMPLTVLSIQFNPVADLSPLQGMQLTSLACSGTKVADLSPLQGMPLSTLLLEDTQVSDLSPLKGMPLTLLKIQGTQVTNLSPLRGLPLTHLEIYGTSVSDVSALQGMPLEILGLTGTLVTDLSPLAGMPLKLLATGTYDGTHITDLSPLKNLPLEQLYLDFKPDRDTALLRSIQTLKTINEKPADEFYRAVEDYRTAAKKPRAFQTPGFESWVKEVAALPAEQQVEAVRQKLVELNPGFDGKLTPVIQNGVVVGLNFDPAEHVTDISPLRALPGLWSLECGNSVGGIPGGLSDLSPLQGLPLIHLYIQQTQVSDLSPLRGMPLQALVCINTNISDLSPLKGMPLMQLNLNFTPVSDLSPLKDLRLTALDIRFTLVDDLAPLQGMPLTTLDIRRTKVSDLSPLKDLPLKTLWLDFQPARDAELLRSIETLETINDKPVAEFWKQVDGKKKPLAFRQPGFEAWVKETAALPAEQQMDAVSKKLMELNPGFDGKVTPTIEAGVVTGLAFLTDNVTDISPARAMVGLKNLTVAGTGFGQKKLSDLTPLKGMSLTYLDCQYTQVADLSPLQGMSLTNLECNNTQVSDLSPLQGMPLTFLKCGGTKVSDLSPLYQMKLTQLQLDNTPVSDLLPLKDTKLTTLYCNRTFVTDLTPLKDMPLNSLNLVQTHVADLSPLKGLPLQHLLLDFKPQWDTELLRSIKSLETINDKPAAEFFEAVEADQAAKKKPLAFQATGFKEWVAKTAALPAEQQVEAVSKKLVELNPGFDGKVTPGIQKGVVTHLEFLTDYVTDISPVRPLTGLLVLDCSKSRPRVQGGLSDLSPLNDMRLIKLFINNTHVSDLTPLKGMKLTELDCVETSISDLSPLKDMPLTVLILHANPVSDLSLLKEMPLTVVSVSFSLVTDLSPLQGKPLSILYFSKTRVADTSLLKGMPLTDLKFDFQPERDTELLHSIKTLETINDKPVAEFWKEVEGNRKNQ